MKHSEPRSEEHKQKIREALKKHWATTDRPRMLEAQNARRGQSPWNKGSFGVQKSKFKGTTLSDERKAELRKTRKPKRIPSRLAARGITLEVYQEKLAAGLKWCCFHKEFESPDGFRNPERADPCRIGLAEWQKRLRQDWTPERKRKYIVAHKGATTEWYESKLSEQSGRCALCGVSPTRKYLAIDHSHSCCPGQNACGKCLRGLLCDVCNKRLGYFEKLIEMASSIIAHPGTWLERALQYLKQYETQEVSQ